VPLLAARRHQQLLKSLKMQATANDSEQDSAQDWQL
jgi:hypothetical protein